MRAIKSNAKWLTLAQVAKVALQVGSVTILARMLSPEVYGIMAVTLAMANFASLFRDAGISAYLIQARELTEDRTSSAFWLSCATGTFVCLLLCAAAKPLSDFFQQAALLWVLIAVSTTFIMSGISAPLQALMERKGGFKVLAATEVASQALALLLAIYAAHRGAGIYSLVIQAVAAPGIVTLSLMYNSSYRPPLFLSKKSTREIWFFSKGYLSYNILSYLSKNSDALVISRLLGSTSMGVYSVAQRLILMPLQNISQVANRAVFPVLSRQQDDLHASRQTYLATVEFISLIVFPLMCGIGAGREVFVLLLLGSKWQGISQLILWMAPIGILQSLSALTGSVLLARGAGSKLFRLGLVGSTTQLAGILIGAQYGLEGIAIGYLAASSVYFVVQASLLRSSISVNLKDIALSCKPAMISSVVMTAAIAVAVEYGETRNIAVISAALLLTGFASYTSALYWAFPASFKRLISSVRRTSA